MKKQLKLNHEINKIKWEPINLYIFFLKNKKYIYIVIYW